MTMDFQSKVEKLLELLDDVENSIITDSPPLDDTISKKLTDRLYTVAELVEETYTSNLDATNLTGIKNEDVTVIRIPTPPRPVAPIPVAVAPSQTPFPPSATIHNSLYRPQPQILDEPAKKRRREAEEMVKKLDRPKTYSCGVPYSGDEKEHEFSEKSKQKIRSALPALKTHRHLFRYMVWSTVERLECQHCRQCTNEHPS